VTDCELAFSGTKYILAYNLASDQLVIRRFLQIPEIFTEICKSWHEGFDVYQFSIEALYTLMKNSISDKSGEVNIPRFSCTSYCLSAEANDDPGMELVIGIFCCQFVIDLAQLLFPYEDDCEIVKFKQELMMFIKQWRLVLAQTSHNAWFAVRYGKSYKDYTRKWDADRAVSDIFMFSRHECRWRSHSITYNAAGNLEKEKRKVKEQEAIERAKQRFDQLFAKPGAQGENESSYGCHGEITSNVEAQDRCSLNSTSTRPGCEVSPATPIPLINTNGTVPVSVDSTPLPTLTQYVGDEVDPMSTEICVISNNKIGRAQKQDHQTTPIHATLGSLLDLVEKHPEIDTDANRRKVGVLLVEMGIMVVD